MFFAKRVKRFVFQGVSHGSGRPDACGRQRGLLRARAHKVPKGPSQDLAPLPARESGAPQRLESTMKPDLHPVYPPSRIVCACGNVIETRSTRGSFHVEICSNCHPFFTGRQKLIDTEGRVDRFQKKYQRVKDAAAAKAAVKETAKKN